MTGDPLPTAEKTGAHRPILGLKLLAFGIVVVGAGADLLSKAWMVRLLTMQPDSAGPFGRIELIPGFLALEGAYNPGVTFGLFGGQTDGIMLFTLLATVALLVWLLATRRHSVLLHVALGMVLAGAVGNLWDRWHWSKVRDFVLVYVGEHEWPNFNLADSMIVVGVILLLTLELFGRRHVPG
ncbi:MAG: signal peptidase II [Planctomycetota bacterium]